MRTTAKCITSALVSCAVALGIAVAPAASADPGGVRPALTTATSAVGGDVIQTGYGHYGGFHGGNGYYAGRGWYPTHGWDNWPWGWYR